MSNTNNTDRLRRSIRSFAKNEKQRDSNLKPLPKRQAKPGRVGQSFQRVGSATGGISSPLFEPDIGDRTHHGLRDVTSSDGLIIIELNVVESIRFEDADGREVIVEFADPYL